MATAAATVATGMGVTMLDIDAIANRAANCLTYKFGMADADTLAHYDAPAMIYAIAAATRVLDGWDVETNEATQGALIDALREALGTVPTEREPAPLPGSEQ